MFLISTKPILHLSCKTTLHRSAHRISPSPSEADTTCVSITREEGRARRGALAHRLSQCERDEATSLAVETQRALATTATLQLSARLWWRPFISASRIRNNCEKTNLPWMVWRCEHATVCETQAGKNKQLLHFCLFVWVAICVFAKSGAWLLQGADTETIVFTIAASGISLNHLTHHCHLLHAHTCTSSAVSQVQKHYKDVIMEASICAWITLRQLQARWWQCCISLNLFCPCQYFLQSPFLPKSGIFLPDCSPNNIEVQPSHLCSQSTGLKLTARRNTGKPVVFRALNKTAVVSQFCCFFFKLFYSYAPTCCFISCCAMLSFDDFAWVMQKKQLF